MSPADADATGQWLITTQTSSYWLDLDLRMLLRLHREIAEPGWEVMKAQLRKDGEAVPLLAVEHAVVGEEAIFVIDVRGDGVVTVRRTTPVVKMERVETR